MWRFWHPELQRFHSFKNFRPGFSAVFLRLHTVWRGKTSTPSLPVCYTISTSRAVCGGLFDNVEKPTMPIFAPMTGDELQAARQRAAERFTQIAVMYVPDGWVTKTRKSLSGVCIYDTKTIIAPNPVTRKSLYIFLHECAHAHLHAPLYWKSRSAYKSKPKHVIEMEAEQWAHARMREHNIPVPKDMTKRAKRYVARKIRQAQRRGAKRIDPQARRYAYG